MTTPRFGYKLMSELHSASSLVDQAVLAEEHGLEFVSISDHIHPWLPDHDHSPFAWSVLGAVAARTGRIGMITGVTCPIVRYHPVIIAQAAATVATMAPGRFTLGLGAGERLNEHVLGTGFPAHDVRHDMLGEAIPLMRELWSGEFVTHRGEYFDADHVRLYDVPDGGVPVVLAVGGDDAVTIALDTGCSGIMATDPEAELVDAWADGGGDRTATWTEVPMAWAPTVDAGIAAARRFRFGLLGWDVMSELPNPKQFDAATAWLSDEQIGTEIPHGPDPEPYVAAIREFVDAGFANLALLPVGDDLDGTLRFFEDEVRPRL